MNGAMLLVISIGRVVFGSLEMVAASGEIYRPCMSLCLKPMGIHNPFFFFFYKSISEKFIK